MYTQVLMVGAERTGLALALELTRRGIDLRIVDKAARFPVASRADGLQPRTLEVFADLGVLDQLLIAGIGVPPTRIHDGQSVAREHRIAKPVWPLRKVLYPNVWFVPQWRTEEILCSRLSSFGTRVQLGVEVVTLQQI